MLSNAFYFVVMLAWNVVNGEAKEYLQGIFNIGMLRDVLVFNVSPFCEPLWYLNAVLYCVAVVMLIDRFGNRKILYVLAPILIVGDMILGQYSIFVFGRYFPNVLTRNWLFFGLPNVSIGMMIREYELTHRLRRYRKILFVTAIILVVGICIEHYLLQKAGVIAEREHYFCAVLLSVVLFLIFAQRTDAEGKVDTWLASIGEKASTGIYIIHPFFAMGLPLAFRKAGLGNLYSALAPVIVFAVAMIAILIYEAVKRKLPKRQPI